MRLIDADTLIEEIKGMFCPDGYKLDFIRKIDNAPTVEPCYQTTSCLDCGNYDKENHNCPRYCEVIKEALDNAQTVKPCLSLDNISDEDIEKFKLIWQRATSKGLRLINERPQGEWITHKTGYLIWEECNKCHAQVGTVGMNFCPNCGARMQKGGAK